VRWLIFCATLIVTSFASNYALERHLCSGWIALFLPVVAIIICTLTALLFSRMVSIHLHQTPISSRQERAAVCIVVAAYCLIYAPSRLFDFDQDPSDQLEALTQAAKSVAVIPQSVSVPSRVGVFGVSGRYGMFFTRFDVVSVYGVTQKESQDRILQQFGEYHRIHCTRPLHVEFYERENWTTWEGTNGVSGGQRGPEKMVRCTVIR
jgi:hypothetical protein